MNFIFCTAKTYLCWLCELHCVCILDPRASKTFPELGSIHFFLLKFFLKYQPEHASECDMWLTKVFYISVVIWQHIYFFISHLTPKLLKASHSQYIIIFFHLQTQLPWCWLKFIVYLYCAKNTDWRFGEKIMMVTQLFTMYKKALSQCRYNKTLLPQSTHHIIIFITIFILQ